MKISPLWAVVDKTSTLSLFWVSLTNVLLSADSWTSKVSAPAPLEVLAALKITRAQSTLPNSGERVARSIAVESNAAVLVTLACMTVLASVAIDETPLGRACTADCRTGGEDQGGVD